jgi:hypothetical protein
MAGFDLAPVASVQTALQYPQYNGNLLGWFNNALANFPNNFSTADIQRHFPWTGTPLSWATDLYPQAVLNPFLGQFTFIQTALGLPPSGCDVGLMGPLQIPAPQIRAACPGPRHFGLTISFTRESAPSPIWPRRT